MAREESTKGPNYQHATRRKKGRQDERVLIWEIGDEAIVQITSDGAI